MGKTENKSLGIVKVDARNRITIPKEVLDFLNLKEGNYVSYEKEGDHIGVFKAYFGVRKNGNGGDEE